MSGITDIIGGILSPVKDIIGEVVVDPNKRNQLEFELQKLGDLANDRLHDEMIAQIGVNNTEAQSKSLFVAGWRPFIGWVSGVGVGWTFVLSPLVEWGSRLAGWTGKMPELDSAQLMTLVMAMLGVGGMRTYEKLKGVSSDNLGPAPKPAVLAQEVRQDRSEAGQPPLPINPPWAR